MNRRAFLKVPAGALALAGSIANCSAGENQVLPDEPGLATSVINAVDFGVTGDGIADDTYALQSFLDAVSTASQPGMIAPGSYRLTSRLRVSSNSTIAMHGATLLCYDPALGSGGYNNDIPILSITNADNVLIEGGTINGRKFAFASTEFKAGIGVYGSRNVTLRDVTAVNCKGDGFHISIYDAGTIPLLGCEDVIMENCFSDRNHRQGLSIIALSSGRFTDCTFSNSSGTNPQSGVDIEPNAPTESVRDLRFERCHFDHNSGSGLIISTIAAGELVQHSISAHNCTMNNNGVWGIWINNGRNLSFGNCRLEDNGDTGLNVLVGTNRDLAVSDCVIRGNGRHGVLLLGYGEGGSIDSMDIVGCQIGSNGTTAPDSFSGIAVGHPNAPAYFQDLTIRECTIGDQDGANQLFGVMFGEAAYVTSGEMVDNDLSGGNNNAVYLTPSVNMEFRDNLGFGGDVWASQAGR